ncbi:MAG: TonB-dependent receptor, partial [Asticcacaulis sp.]
MAASISASTLLAAASFSAAAAAQRPAAFDLDIPAAPLARQLASLAFRSNISIGGADPALCGGRPIPLHGRFTPAEALRFLLSQSHCTATPINAVTWRLELRPVNPPRPARTPAPQVLPQQADEITVLVSRRPQPVSGTASALSVVPPSVIESGAYDLAQVASHVPGMVVTNLGPGRDKILLRGLSDSILTGRTQSLVGLYLDDAPLTYNAPDPDLLLVDMARIEVLKGPQGALYGQGSLSGVVRLVTNRPDLGRMGSAFDAGIGLTENGEPSQRLTAMVNIPLARDVLGLRLVGYEDQSGGFIKDPAAGRKASNTTQRSGGRLSLQWRLDNGFTATGTILGQRLQSNNSQYVTGNRRPFERSTPVAEPHNNNLRDTSLDIEGPTPFGALKISLNSLRHHVLSGYDAQPLANVVAVPNSGALFYDEEQDITLDTQEVSLVSPSSSRLRWLGGAFSAFSREHFTPHLIDLYTKRVLYNEDRLDQLHDLALFGEADYDLTPRLTVSGGLRYAVTRHDTESQINHVRLTNYQAYGDITGKINARRLSYTLSLSYRPAPRQVWYAQIANGYRTGGFNTTTLAVTVVPSIYDGDGLESIEGGWRYRTEGNRLRMNVAVFNMHWHNIQSDQLRSTGLPVTLNVGNGTNTGVEFEGDWQALPQ